jgi:hypothetical protein
MPNIFSVSGSPITTSGTLAVTLATQSANTVQAGPTTGAAAAPTFRALVAADIPTPLTSSTSGNAGTATALAANGANCSAGSAAGGVDARGAAEDCTPYLTSAPTVGFDDLETGTNTAAAMTVGSGASLAASGSGTIAATTSAALAANPANCDAGQAPRGVDASGAVENCTAYLTSAPSPGFADVGAGTNTNALVVGAGGSFKKASTGTIDGSAIDADGDGVRELTVASTRVNFDPDDDGVVESYIDANGDLSWGDASVTRAGAGGVDIENGSGSYAYLRMTGSQHFNAGTMKIIIDPGVFFDTQIRLASDIEVAWTSNAQASAGSIDARIGRGAAGVVQVDGGTTSTGVVLRLTPLATAPAACTAYSDLYADTSGALCWCSATNTWSVVTGGGSCV